MNVTAKLKIGTQHQQAGRLQAAMAVYDEILDDLPDHPDALHLSGLVIFQQGNSQSAIQVFGQRTGQFTTEHARQLGSLNLDGCLKVQCPIFKTSGNPMDEKKMLDGLEKTVKYPMTAYVNAVRSK